MLVNIPGAEIQYVNVRRFDDADKPSEKGIYQIEISTGGATTSITFLGSKSIKEFVEKLNREVSTI